jgi:hypothetical protein
MGGFLQIPLFHAPTKNLNKLILYKSKKRPFNGSTFPTDYLLPEVEVV